ncbi:hypothetical protein [Fulvimarina sp. MAC3]|uniref:hypothetical protein n=1 Tax=Fulvimarina sp. MAC3 TaxID=3148887 RepID=UPI0031FBBB8D
MPIPHVRFAGLALAAWASLSLPTPAKAQDMAGDRFSPEDIITVATGDFDGNGAADAAMIVSPQDEDAFASDLYIFLEGTGEDTPPGKLGLALFRKGAAWGARPLLAGQVPHLTALSNGSLRIETENIAIGRNAWEQHVTLAYRDGRFRVAGFTYNAYDRLQEEGEVSCDLNLFSGKGQINGATVRFDVSRTPFEDRKDEDALQICGIN